MTHVEYIAKIKFKTLMLKSSLSDYSDAYILIKGIIAAQAGDSPNYGDKEVVLKNCASFTDCISEINNTQIDNDNDIDVVMPMYNLIENSNTSSKTSESLWQHYRDKSDLTNPGIITNFHAAKKSALFKLKKKICKTAANGRKGVEIMVPLKYVSKFWRTLEMPLINYEINLILT